MELIDIANILEREGRVLVDTNVLQCRTNKGGVTDIGKILGAKNYSDLKYFDLEGVIESLDSFLSFLRTGKERGITYIIPEVKTEWEDFYKLIKRKKSRFNRKKPYVTNSNREIKKNLDAIILRLQRLLKLSPKLFYKVSSGKDYSILVRILKAISNYCLKKKGTKRHYPASLYTDEKLIALAFYISLFDKERIGILTRDTDFIALIRRSFYLLCADDTENNEFFIKGLNDNPVSVYLLGASRTPQGKRERLIKIVSTSDLQLSERFSIKGVGEEENENQKRYIENLLEEVQRNLNYDHTHIA